MAQREPVHVPVLIAGGGLGGLALAIDLAQRGRRVHVIEKNPAFSEVILSDSPELLYYVSFSRLRHPPKGTSCYRSLQGCHELPSALRMSAEYNRGVEGAEQMFRL